MKILRFVWLTLLAVALAGCNSGGSDDQSAPVSGDTVVLLSTPVLTDDGTLSVEFTVKNANGEAMTLTSDPSFGLMKLIQRPDNPNQGATTLNKTMWKSFTYRERDGTTTPYVETTSNLETLAPGQYRHTFSFDVTSVVDPADSNNAVIPWDENLLHRITFEYKLESGDRLSEVIDWVPSGNVPPMTRNILDGSSCTDCHQDTGIKHGSRKDPRVCVACHNNSVPETSRRSLETIVHTVHGDIFELITEDGNGDPVANDPTLASSYAFVDKPYPQDIRNCDTCHKAPVAGKTDDAANWMKQDYDSCQTCHQVRDTLASGAGFSVHVGEVGANWSAASCTSCHTEGNPDGLNVHDVHIGRLNKIKQASDMLSISIENARIESNNYVVDVKVELDGVGINSITALTPYLDINTNKTTPRVYLLLNWDNGSGPELSYGTTQLNMVTSDGTSDNCSPQGNGLFVCTQDISGYAKQPDANSKLTVSVAELMLCADRRAGVLKACADLTNEKPDYIPWRVAAKNSKGAFDFGGIAISHALPVGADVESCTNCHKDFTIHETRHGATDLQQCVNCHNSERAAFYAGFPADLKYHVHSYHTFGSHRDGSPTYPGDSNNCEGCHTRDQYNLPNQQNARPSLATSNGEAKWFSAALVTCGACHVGIENEDGSQQALGDADVNTFPLDHMIRNGAVFAADTAEEATGTEQCASCHAVGMLKGVDSVHNVYDYR
ncbi:OmcA/MtrC family decaheme c-type cytochrome [Vibrio parahaemolyticus]|uniref:OmcA/MtrC family decaheme c-type cytochrome n=1 Tax=Vibrio mediterranei TaxID=689 RepID=UPI0040695AF6